MKNLSKAHLVLAAALAYLGTCTAAPAFEMKGLRVGMSESQFKAANPGAQCGKAYSKPALDKAVPPMPAVRTCKVPNYTLAGKQAKETQFLFYGDQFGHVFHSFYASDARALQAALTEKYGAPKVDLSSNTVEWQFADSTAMRLRREPGDTVYLFMDSQPSRDYLVRELEIERKAAQKDL